MLTWNSFIGQFVHPVGGDIIGGIVILPAASFTLLQNMKIQHNIKVIINPFFRKVVSEGVKRLQSGEQWNALLDYTIIAWGYVQVI